MPKKKVNHNKCPLCRKTMTRQRHSIVKIIRPETFYRWRPRNAPVWIKPQKPTLQSLVTMCGFCKEKIKQGHWHLLTKWCDANSYILNAAPYFDSDAIIQKLFDKKEQKRKKTHSSYRGSNVKYGWTADHNRIVQQRRKPVNPKIWTTEESKEFHKLLMEEEHEIMTQLEQEFLEPLNNWLQN